MFKLSKGLFLKEKIFFFNLWNEEQSDSARKIKINFTQVFQNIMETFSEGILCKNFF